MDGVLPAKLLGKDGEVSRPSSKVTGLYFSAHWCGPCRSFTPQLATFYKAMKDKGEDFEIVFVSSDRDQESFDSYYAEHPWLALPYSDRDAKNRLSKKFKVQGIPTLVLLDADGNVITKDARGEVGGDPTGAKFPWKPKSLAELLDAEYLGKDGKKLSKTEALGGKVTGIYFSAHWCPPCRGFTPELIKTYNTLKAAGKPFEIVFASSDRNQAAFDEYYGEMPWLAIPFDNRDLKAQLSQHFEVGGIPALVLIDEDGKVIRTDARGAVGADPEGASFPWLPKALNDLADGPGQINDMASLILFSKDEGLTGALDAVATAHWAQAKEAGADPEYAFFTAKDLKEDITSRVLQLTGQTATEGEPLLILLDIPDSGAYYVHKGEVKPDTFAQMLKDYEGKKLTRNQLS